MGTCTNCCSTYISREGEEFIKTIFESFSKHNLFIFNTMIQYLEPLCKENKVYIMDFLYVMNNFYSNNPEIRELQKYLLEKYFLETRLKEMYFYEYLIIILPLMNMKVSEKKSLFKLLLGYLNSHKTSFLPGTNKEVIFFIYDFVCVFITNTIIHFLEHKLKIKENDAYLIKLFSNPNQISNKKKDREETESRKILEDLINSRNYVFNENNVCLEVDKLFINDYSGEENRTISDEETKITRNNIINNSETYEMSDEYKSYISKMKKIETDNKNTNKKVIYCMLNFNEIRDYFISQYNDINSNY